MSSDLTVDAWLSVPSYPEKCVMSEIETLTAAVKFLQTEGCKRDAALAECYRLTGADPDGNEDWRLAPDAVGEVRRLRAEYDEACRELLELRWRPIAEAPSGKAILLWAIGRDGNRKVGVGQRRPDGTWTWPPWRTPTHFIPLKALGVPPGVKP